MTSSADNEKDKTYQNFDDNQSIIRKIFSWKYLIAIGIFVIICGIAAGQYASRSSIDSLLHRTSIDNEQVATLISTLSSDAIILEDGPLLETIIEQTVQVIPLMHSVTFENEDRITLSSWHTHRTHGEDEIIKYSRTIEIEGEIFGYLTLEWDITNQLSEIEQASLATSLFVSGLSLAFSVIILAIIFYGRKLIDYREQLIIHSREAMRRAEEENEYKSNFLAHMSHELRTPLNAVLGMSQVLAYSEKRPMTPQSVAKEAKVIYNAGNHLLAIVNDILDTEKIRAGKMSLDEETFPVMDSVSPVISILGQQAESLNIKLIEDYRIHEQLQLKADKRLIKQILFNLIGNSLKFSEAETEIRVEVILTDQNEIRYSVSDHGCGIAKEDIQQILKPYAQTASSRDQKVKGTGLGLPLCADLAKLHGATFQLSSELGKGTTVAFQMPASRTVSGNKSHSAPA